VEPVRQFSLLLLLNYLLSGTDPGHFCMRYRTVISATCRKPSDALRVSSELDLSLNMNFFEQVLEYVMHSDTKTALNILTIGPSWHLACSFQYFGALGATRGSADGAGTSAAAAVLRPLRNDLLLTLKSRCRTIAELWSGLLAAPPTLASTHP
jgi:hypothetical protein